MPKIPVHKLPQTLNAEVTSRAIRKSRTITDLGFGHADWLHKVAKENPKAKLHGVELPGNKHRVPAGTTLHSNFDRWLSSPRKFNFVNAGFFFWNYAEKLQDEYLNEMQRKNLELRKGQIVLQSIEALSTVVLA
ncbi:MAG TPA: hypothetical protein VJG83_06755 [archaeon]|nr:hypothetical protein [archaeon]